MSDQSTAFSRSAFMAGLPAIALAASNAGIARAAGNVSLQVGLAPTDATSQIFYAIDRGMFRSAGIDVTVNVLQNSGAVDSALSSGAVDIAASSVAVVANAFQRGISLRFIGTGCVYTSAVAPTANIVVAKDSPLHSAADLNGKLIAVNGLKDITQIAPQAWLDKNGADLSSIKFVEIPFGTMPLALAQGRVAAANLTSSFIARAKDQVRILGNALGAIGDRYLVIGWVATDSWLQKNPELARRVVGVMAQSATWANGHQQESAQILAPHLKVTPEEIASVSRAVFDDRPRMSPSLVQPVIDAAVKYGALEHAMPATNVIWPG
jgi:NitT/TauT family transport system substrate-binding protein